MVVAWEEHNYAVRNYGADVEKSATEFVDHGVVGSVFECEFEFLSCGTFAYVPCNEVFFRDDVAA